MPDSLRLKSTTNGSLDSVRFVAPATCSVAPTTDDDLANKKYVDDSVDAIDVANATFSQPILQILLDASGNNKNNIALGQYSLTNYNSTSIGVDNTAVGNEALRYNTTGESNTAVSANALQNNTTGYRNTAVGYNSMPYNTTGYSNTAVGYNSMPNNTTGQSNTAIGYNSLPNAPDGRYNTAVGVNSMRSMNSNSQYSVAIGYDAGNSSTWGNDSYGITLLGAGTSINGVYQYSTAVGSTAQIKKSNQIVLGTANEVITIPKFTTAGVVHNLANGDLTSSLIVAADISNNAITSEKILNGTILGSDISSNTITADNIADATITSAKIATGTIVGTNIATATITSEKILDGTILGSDISSNTITAANIANGTITAVKLDTSLALSGNPTTTTQSSSDNSTNIATTAFVKSLSYLTQTSATNTYLTQSSASSTYLTQSSASSTYAPLASPTFTGNPTAPTPDTSDNDTTVATTAFVKNQSYITSSSLGVMSVTEPVSPVAGSFYFEPSSGYFRIYNDGSWRNFAQ